jgi:guanosine-3',5'-bis(diphosphate) 3'-pyrophosphohydrolase
MQRHQKLLNTECPHQNYNSSKWNYENNELSKRIDEMFEYVKNVTDGYNDKVFSVLDELTTKLVLAYINGESFTKNDIVDIINAINFSALKHCTQKRKDKDQTSYIIHPLSVALLMINIGKVRNSEFISAALLHDTIEDTETTADELILVFGKTVARLVQEVTDDKTLSYDERKIAQIKNASHKSTGAALIKLCDKISNTSDLHDNPPSDWTNDRKLNYYRHAKQVITNLPWCNDNLFSMAMFIINSNLQE